MKSIPKSKKPKLGQLVCGACGQGLNPATAVEVELSATDGNWYKGGIPEGHESQGWWDLGPDCAKKAIKK